MNRVSTSSPYHNPSIHISSPRGLFNWGGLGVSGERLKPSRPSGPFSYGGAEVLVITS